MTWLAISAGPYNAEKSTPWSTSLAGSGSQGREPPTSQDNATCQALDRITTADKCKWRGLTVCS